MHISSNKNFNLIPEDNFRQILLLLFFAIIMFVIRTVPIWHLIFTDWPGEYGKFVNFSADDAVYHMRFVHNAIQHFPWRVFFDPFTHFPFGGQIHFGPLFTLTIAASALIAGLGHPSPELINLVGAYTPVIMGVLCLIPIYFIAQNLCNKTAAILTALVLTFLPGEFLQRTSLGFTDHHAAETLFSTITCAYFIYALNVGQHSPFNFKQTLHYGVLTGITFGLFILIWPAALMFGAIFLLFFITQLIVDHFNNRPAKYLLILALLIFSISTVVVLPYALVNPHIELMGYSLAQPLILIAMTTIFTGCYGIHILCNKNQLAKNLYAIVLATLFILTGFILHRYTPKFFAVMQDGCKMLFEPTPGMKTVSEVHPSVLNASGNQYTIKVLWNTYFWSLLFAAIGFLHLCYRTYKNINPAEVLLLIWTIIITLAAFAQCRFNYYLATNIAILAGCYGILPIINFLASFNPKRKIYLKLQKTILSLVFSIIVILIIDPIIMLLIDK